MEFAVAGLAPAPSGRPFELWLTRNGELGAALRELPHGRDGAAVVPMNAPYDLTEYDGWVVVEEGSETPLLTTLSWAPPGGHDQRRAGVTRAAEPARRACIRRVSRLSSDPGSPGSTAA